MGVFGRLRCLATWDMVGEYKANDAVLGTRLVAARQPQVPRAATDLQAATHIE